jgi:flagellar protein FliS
MKLNDGHCLYKEADVACSAPQLTLMLYDAAIRYLREAVAHLRAGRMVEKGKAVESAFECLLELRHALNRTEGGPMVDSLDSLYDLLGTKLTIGNASRDVNQLGQVMASLESLREAWAQLFERLRGEGKLARMGSFAP